MFWKLIIGWIQISNYFKVCRIDCNILTVHSNVPASSAAYAHMGKSKHDWQTGGPIRREYLCSWYCTAYGYNINRRARACARGWNWKGQIKYSIFPKGANQRTFLPIRARIDWYRFCIAHMQKDTCTYAREGANQMHKLHAGGQSERSEPISKMSMEMVRKNFLRISWKINTTCTRWYRCQTIWNRNNKKPQNSN